MTVTKTATYSSGWVTLAGTLAEVMVQLNTDGITKSRIVSVFWDATANKVNLIYI